MTNFFTLPDKEKNFQSHMLHVLAISWPVVTAIIVSNGFYHFPHLWMRWLVFIGIALFMAIFTISLNRLGYVRLASRLFTAILWLYITIPCYTAGGIVAPGILSQVSVIFTAGLLLGWRGGLAVGLLTLAADYGFVYLEQTGQLPVPTVPHNPLTRWIGAIIPFGTVMLLQYYATNHLYSGMLKLQSEVKKREEAERIKDTTVNDLGERVKELKTVYTVSRILQNEKIPDENRFAQIVEAIPSGWRYHDITAARVSIGNTEYTSRNYAPSPYSMEAEMNTSKGTKVRIDIVYTQAKPVSDEGPFLKEERSLLNMLVEMIKIDLERKERSAELNDYKYALDIASLVAITGPDDRFVFVNDNFCNISKYSVDELLGQPWSKLGSGIHPPEYFAELDLAMKKGKPYRGEFCDRAKDGTLYWVDTTVIPFFDESGKIYQHLSINHDITAQKKATELFRYQFENSPDIIVIVNQNMKIESLNRVRPNMGLTPADFIGKDCFEVLPEESREVAKEAVTRCFATGENIEIETEVSGNRWMRSRFVPITIDGRINNIMVIATEITKQRDAEQQLRQSEERTRALIENIADAIILIDEDENLIYQSPSAARISGYSPEDSYGKKAISFIHHDDLKEFKTFLQKAINAPGEPLAAQFRIRHKSGHTIWIEGTLINMLHDENIKGIVVNYGDVTERKEAEAKIVRSEQLLRKITSQIPGNTYMFEIDETGLPKVLFVNRGTDPYNHSFSVGQLIEHPEKLSEELHPDDTLKYNNALKEAYRTQGLISVQYRMIINGMIRWRWMQASPEKDTNGKIIWYGAASDITPIVDYIASIEQIIFDIGHVIRRPISTMLGMTKLITDSNFNENEMKEMAHHLHTISEEMDTFITELNLEYHRKRQHTQFNIDITSEIDRRSTLFK